ncbi:scabin-related ADP-ribosyltransferase [Streptomyces formicae]|uniref:scabin-related ADP-ribosyltransferase n=1 Tax=Streptomyces formicae TaxID=1616117 RepID=UPI000BF40251|nr:hypothetical protein [Streptomyces formicae]
MQRLQALQAAAGNAAVVQLLQQDERQGEQRGEQPVVQRAPGQDSMAMDIDQRDFSDAEEISDGGMDSEADEADYQSFMAERGKYPRSTTPTPQEAVGFGDSKYGVDPAKVKTMREDKAGGGRPLPPLLYRKDNELLYRWDKRTPDQILGKGFDAWNDKLPASLRHYQKLLQKTGFVSTTRSPGGYVPDWARQPDGSGYRYVISAPGGIDLVDTLGTTSFVQQQEVIFWRGMTAGHILRAELCDKNGNILKVIPAGGAGAGQAAAGQGDAMDIDSD